MLKKIAVLSLTLTSVALAIPAKADEAYSCAVEVAVATPPIQQNENVAFNMTNDNGVSRSITLNGGTAPKTVDNLPCSTTPYIISATYYPIAPSQNANPGQIGQCMLKAGAVYLAKPNSSASVVFPNDFICQ